ncbi:MAG: inositol-3-phosphate synthase, partial [Sulfolobales archaeon]
MIRVGIIGVGNIASMLVQSIEFYKSSSQKPEGLIHTKIGGYEISDINVVYAIDVSKYKVGRDLRD